MVSRDVPATGDAPHAPADPRAAVQRVVESVSQTWHRQPPAIAGRIEVPLSVVAALSLLAPAAADSSTLLAAYLDRVPTAEFGGMLRDLWAVYVNLRPDLVARAYPLFSWLFDPDVSDELIGAARTTAAAAVRAGQVEITGTGARHEVDLLGVLLTELRSDAARKGHGQVYTPADLAQITAELLGVGQTAEGATIHEPAAGTGGMLRAAAQAIRAAGRDPAAMRWVAVDIDELAIACLAVNTHLWGLGLNVLLGVGNALTDQWCERAEGERAECIELARTVRRDRLALRLLTTLSALVDEVADERQPSDHPSAPQP